MFNPTTAQRVNERYRRLLLNQFPNWELESGAELTLNYDFVAQPTLAPITNPNTGLPAGPTLDITRTTTKMFTDWENVLRIVMSAEASFTGARWVENLCESSNDFSASKWTRRTTISITTGVSDPDGGNNATTITSDGASSILSHITPSGKVLGDVTTSVWVRRRTGTGRIDLYTGYGATRREITGLTTSWQKIVFTEPVLLPASDIFGFFFNVSGDEIDVYHYQVEDVSGQDDLAPSEYIATTTGPAGRTYTTKRRTNRILHSNDPDTSPWSAQLSSLTEAVAANPLDGTVDAWSLDEDGTSASTRNVRQKVVSKIGQQYTFSVYLKASNRTWARPTFNASGFPANAYAYFNLSAGTIGIVGSGATAVILDVGDGWYRCSLTATAIANTDSYHQVFIAEADGDHSFDGLSQESLLVYGFQAETGPIATAYIPTTTTVASSGFDTDLTSIIGLLPEEARTNICLQSEDFTTSWSTSNASPVANQTIAPDGSLTADKFIDDAAAGGPTTVRLKQTITLSDATVYTVSVFAKKDQLDWFEIQLVGAVKVPEQYYDLTNGVVGTANGDVDSSGIESVGNGWYRCWLVWTSDATTTEHRIHVAEADGDKTVDDDGTSSVFIWGAQVELGASPTSYIPTVASSVTRNNDVIRSTDVAWHNEAAGTYYSKATRGVDVANIIYNVGDGTTANRAIMSTSTVGRAKFSAISSLGDSASLTSATTIFPVNVETRLAVGYALNNVEMFVEGARTGTGDQTAVPPTSISQLDVGHGETGGASFNGHIAQIRYYNDAPTLEELEDLSNGLLSPVT